MMKQAKLAVALGLTSLLVGCAGSQVSQFTYSENMPVNEAVKTEKCYDASVLLAVGLDKAQTVAKRVITGLDATIDEESATHIKAQRNRHIGVFVGSGGEELFVNLKPVTDDQTFVSVTTKTGLVGAAGMKAWSCKAVDEMIKMVK